MKILAGFTIFMAYLILFWGIPVLILGFNKNAFNMSFWVHVGVISCFGLVGVLIWAVDTLFLN